MLKSLGKKENFFVNAPQSPEREVRAQTYD